MRRSKTVGLAAAVIAGVCLVLPCCGERTESKMKPGEVNLVIRGFQSVFEPAGVPLTWEQKMRIIEVHTPDYPKDMRSVFGVLTHEQKQALVNNERGHLAYTKCPLSESQAARIMAIGPGSKEKSVFEILTHEQLMITIEDTPSADTFEWRI